MQRQIDPTTYHTMKQRQQELSPERLNQASASSRKRALDDVLQSNSMLDLICKRRRTLAWQPNYLAPALGCTMQIGVFMQLFAKQTSTETMIDMLLQFMSRDFSDEALQLHCLRTLTASLPCITDKAIYDSVMTAMERNPQSLQVQVEGCTAVRRYVKSTGSLDSRGLRTLVNALQNHSDLYFQYLAIDCIRVASRDEKSRANLAQEIGAIRAILRTLQTHTHDSRLQELGLSLLSYLVEEVPCRKSILKDGGVDGIVNAMKNHPTNALIQCNGAAALCWLVHLEHESAKAALLANPFGVHTILEISKLYVGNASVFGNCICILCGVRVGDTSVLEEYPELGTITRHLVQVGMRKNPQALKVQRNCMMLLRLVTEAEDATGIPEDLVKESYDDCIEVILASMKSFPDEIDIQSQGCRALSNLAMNATVRPMLLAKEGCINQVTSALMKHKNDYRVQQGACWFLHGILQEFAENQGPTAFGGGIAVLEIMLEGLGVEIGPSEEQG